MMEPRMNPSEFRPQSAFSAACQCLPRGAMPMSGMDFENKVVQGVRIERLTVDRQSEHRHLVPLGKVKELGLRDSCRHALQGAKIDNPVNMPPVPLGDRVSECQQTDQQDQGEIFASSYTLKA